MMDGNETPNLLADDYSKLSDEEQMIFNLDADRANFIRIAEHLLLSVKHIRGRKRRKRLRRYLKLNLEVAGGALKPEWAARIREIDAKVIDGLGKEMLKRDIDTSPLVSMMSQLNYAEG